VELWNSPEPAATRLWWDLLNQGRRVFAETSSDSHHRANAEPGFRRTYVYLGSEAFSASAVIRALRTGRSFLSRGALLDFKVNGARPGSTLSSVPSQPLSVAIAARGAAPISRIDLIHNGSVVSTLPVNGRREFSTLVSLPPAPGWYLAQVWGTDKESTPLALCNPVFVPEKNVETTGNTGTRK
jgi:hypothetical protein